jgi:hypothetical protein
MQLTWRDGSATILAALVVAVLLAVTQAWAWPLLGDYRSGVIALTIIGFAMCSVGLLATEGTAFKQPFMVVGSVLGVVALGLVILGVIFATQALFVALAITVVALWIVTTADHAVPAAHDRSLHTGA